MNANLKNVLSVLECPVCTEYMHTVIPQCCSGHSICIYCKRKCSHCPVCKSQFSDIRNYTLEKVICAMKFPCSNNSAGCNVSLNPVEIFHHMQNCEYAIYSCPSAEFLQCSWKGKLDTIKDHLKKAHNYVLSTDFTSQEITTSVAYLFAYKTVFKVYRRYLADLGLVQWTVQYIGLKHKTEDYLFRLDFYDPEDVGYQLILTGNCIPLCNDAEAFDGNKLSIHEEMLKPYKVGNNYEHRVIILPKRNK